MSQMMDPGMMGPPDAAPPEMPPPDAGGGGGLPPDLVAALSGGGGAPPTNSPDMMAQGPMAGAPTEEADEQVSDDPLSMVRDAIELLRMAGEAEPDDVRTHAIDKIQAELQKLLADESTKTSKLRSALGG